MPRAAVIRVSAFLGDKFLVVGGGEQSVQLSRIFQRYFDHPGAVRVFIDLFRRGCQVVVDSVTVPETGAYRSETAFTDSTEPKVLPAAISAPTLGKSTKTMSPSDSWA